VDLGEGDECLQRGRDVQLVRDGRGTQIGGGQRYEPLQAIEIDRDAVQRVTARGAGWMAAAACSRVRMGRFR
jgi:hypothetical protein